MINRMLPRPKPATVSRRERVDHTRELTRDRVAGAGLASMLAGRQHGFESIGEQWRLLAQVFRHA
jgi:hypothetical protein